MDNQNELIVPIRSQVDTDCYPLMRSEVYVFEDGWKLIRRIPYWRPALESIIDPQGLICFSPEQTASSQTVQ